VAAVQVREGVNVARVEGGTGYSKRETLDTDGGSFAWAGPRRTDTGFPG
jgi:hypothetical protein